MDNKYYYTIYNLTVCSDLDFMQLIPVEPCEADINISMGNAREQIEGKVPDFGLACIAQTDFGYLVNKTVYLAIEKGNAIYYEPKEGANMAYLRNYILGWGLAILGVQRQTPAIHCSVISKDKGAVIISGNSGSGKSTLTKEFLDMGYHLMADDIAYCEYHEKDKSVWVNSCFPFQKLCRNEVERTGKDMKEMIYIDEDKDKFLVPCHEIFDVGSKPLKAFIILQKANCANVEHYTYKGLEALHPILSSLFISRLIGKRIFEPHLTAPCLKIASAMPVHVIRRPEDRDTLSEIIQITKEIIENA